MRASRAVAKAQTVLRTTIHSTLLCALGVAMTSAPTLAADAKDASYRFDIADQTLAEALRSYAQVSGQQIIFIESALDGSKHVSLQGNFTASDALDKLLEGTGLVYQRSPSGAIMLKRPGEPATWNRTSYETSGGYQSTGAAAEEESNLGITEIIVTASKRREAVSKVAGAVSAVSGEKLEERSVVSLQDYLAFLPGVTLDSGENIGSGSLQIRGIATQSIGSSVATYIDEIPVSNANSIAGNNAWDIDPTDLERVEVLKGPQGTLYGASSLGGVLKYVTRAPSLTDFTIKTSEDVSFTHSGTPSVKVRGSLSTPIIEDQLGFSLSSFYRRDGGYVDVHNGENDFNSADVWGGRASLLYRPLENLSVRLTALLQDTNSKGGSGYDVDPVTFVPYYGDLIQSNYGGTFDLRQQLYSAEINYDFGAVSLVSATGYTKSDSTNTADVTLGYMALNSPYASLATPLKSGGGGNYDKITQELRLVSQRMGGFEWMLGAFYQSEDLDTDTSIFQYGLDGNRTALAPFSVALRHATLDEYAGYLNVTYYLTERLDITAGYRHSEIDQTHRRVSYGVRRNRNNPLLQTVDAQDFSENSDTYLGAIRWRPTDSVTLYGRAASGYRPGGGRPVPDTAPEGTLNYFTSDNIWSYEVGSKLRVFDNRLSIDAAGFWIDWTNIQALESFPPFLTDGNAGAARSKGVELALALAATAHINVGLNGAYTDAKYTEDAPSIGVVAGDQLTLVPEWTVSGNIDYRRPLMGDWDGFAGADFRYQSDRLGTYTLLPSFTVFNLNFGIQKPQYRLNLYVQNLTDERAFLGTGLGGLPNFPLQVSINRPRTIGVLFQQNF
jgi:outer membrane receptor protein involved in Fe transport